MAEAIKLRGAAHSFEGKVFTVVSCSTISEEIIEQMQTLTPDARELLSRRNSAFSGILGPDGNLVGDGLVDDEGIVYADIDLNRCIQPKQMHDILGHYNRFDVLDLKVNRTALQPTSFVVQEPDNAANSAGDPPFSAPGIKGNDREHNI